MNAWIWVGPLGGALILTAILTPLVRGASVALGRIAQVRRDRWHRRPTPTLGGVAIFLGFGLTVIGFLLLGMEPRPYLVAGGRGILPWAPWEGLVAAGTLAFLVGLADDFLRMNPVSKLLGQLTGASLLVMSGIGLWITGNHTLDVLVSLLWFVGMTNALNLLDNMDGLAAGVAVIAALFLAAIFTMENRPPLALFSLALAGAAGGFLLFNYPPAKIFMGDSGSLFLGMTLAGLALSPGAGLSRSLLAVVGVPALVLAVPILDTTLVTVSRLLEGRSPAQGGRDHTSHRLVRLGLSEERAVLLLWVLAAMGGGVGLLLRTAPRTTAVAVGGLAVMVLALLGGYLLQVHFENLRQEGVKPTQLYQRVAALHRRYPVLLLALDGLVFALAYYGAYLLRWDDPRLQLELEYFKRSLPVVLAVKMTVFGVSGVYRMSLRHFSLRDALTVSRSVLLGTAFVALALLALQRTGLSRGVLAVDFLLALPLAVGSRLFFRVLDTYAHRWAEGRRAAVVVGDVEWFGLVLAELESGRWPEFRVAALVDPRGDRRGGRLRGCPFYGGQDALQRALKDTGAGRVVLVEVGAGGSGGDRRNVEEEGSRLPPRGPVFGEVPWAPWPEGEKVEFYSLKVDISLVKYGSPAAREEPGRGPGGSEGGVVSPPQKAET